MEPTEDLELVKSTLCGNAQAFEALVDRYKHMVYTLAMRMLRNCEDAEEAAQDAFLKAYKGLEGYQGDSRFSTWLYKIAYHNCLDRIKKEKSRPGTVSLEFVRSDGQGEFGGILKDLEYEDQKRRIRHAINCLSERDAAIINMFYYDEMTIQEISDVTNLSPEAVKVRLFRSRKRLASALRSMPEAEKR